MHVFLVLQSDFLGIGQFGWKARAVVTVDKIGYTRHWNQKEPIKPLVQFSCPRLLWTLPQFTFFWPHFRWCSIQIFHADQVVFKVVEISICKQAKGQSLTACNHDSHNTALIYESAQLNAVTLARNNRQEVSAHFREIGSQNKWMWWLIIAIKHLPLSMIPGFSDAILHLYQHSGNVRVVRYIRKKNFGGKTSD